MTRGSERWLAALVYLAMASVIFGASFRSDRIFVPMHTGSLEPWRSTLSEEARAQLSKGDYTDASDKLISFRADDQITMEAIRAGRLPLWNPTNAGGVPHLAQGLYGVFYPPHWIMRWLEPERAYGFLAALHCALAAFFTFLYVRSLGAGFAGALLGGLAFGFSGCLTARAHYYQYLETVAWLPLGMLLVDRWFEGSRRAGFLLSVVAALVLLPGWPQIAVFTIFTWTVALLCRTVGSDLVVPVQRSIGIVLVCGALAAATTLVLADALWFVAMWPFVAALLVFLSASGRSAFLARMARFAGFIALGGAIAACQYLPAVGWMGEGERAVAPPELLCRLGIPVRATLALLFDGIFGLPGTPYLHSLFDLPEIWPLSAAQASDDALRSSLVNLIENACYVGVITLPLVLLGTGARGRRRSPLVLAFLVFLGFAMGRTAFVYPLWFLPGFQFGSDPRRALVIVAFAAAALAGLGFDAIFRGEARRATRAIAAVLFALGAASFLATQVLSDGALIAPFVDHVKALAAQLSATYSVPADAEPLAALHVRSVLERAGLVMAGSGVALALATLRLPLFLRALPAILALGADLALAAAPRTETKPRADFLTTTPLIERLQQTVGRSGRIARWSATPALPEIVLPPNFAGCFGLLDAWCYTVSPSKRWLEMAGRVAPDVPGFASGVRILPLSKPEHLASRALDLMAVAAIVGKGPLPTPLPAGITLDAQFDDCWILKNGRALPRAFCVANTATRDLDWLLDPANDPRSIATVASTEHGASAISIPCAARARIEVDSAERVVVALSETSEPGFLVLLDAFAPDWTAEVDGAPAEVQRADHAFRGVAYPKGARSIEFRYEPRAVRAGTWLSVFALLVALGGVALASTSRRTGWSAAPPPRA